MMLKTRLTLKPGQKWTRKLVEQYGNRLLCIRYRYDESAKKRFKTIELIIEESEWVPEEIPVQGVVIVGLKIEYHEKELQNRIKKGGGVWNREKKLWFLEYDKVLELGLGARISATSFSNATGTNAEFAN